MRKNGRIYASEFKNEAVKLVHNSDKPIHEVAASLGVSKSSLYRWRAEFTAVIDETLPNLEQEKGQDVDIIELERRIHDQNEELNRVKKALEANQLIPSAGHIEEQRAFNNHQVDLNTSIGDFVRIDQVIAAVLKWWWLLILAGVVAAVIGYSVSQRLPSVYQATATLMVGQSILATNLDSRDIQTSELLAVTYADIAQREPILQGTVEALALDINWQQLRKQVKTSLVNGTQLLEVVVEAGSPQEAQMIANEIARQLILVSPTALQNQENVENTSFAEQRIDDLRSRIENGQKQIEALEIALTTATTAGEMSTLQDEIDTLEGLMNDWEVNYIQLLSFIENKNPVNYLAVIEEAHARQTPVRPLIQLNTLLAGVVGLLLVLAIIFVIEYLDNSIKSTDDLNQVLNMIPLGGVRQMKGKNLPDKLITSQGLLSPVSEAYRMIRTNLQFMSVDRACKIIMVTSTTPAEGKSTTVANLGVVMAHAGLETIIVDADLRGSTQHKIFQLPLQKGLTDFISRPESDIVHYLAPTKMARLRVLTSGALPPNPSELLGSQRMESLLVRLKEIADVVIFDSPPVAAYTDAVVLSSKVDGVVLVIKAGQTRRNVVKLTIPVLQRAGANILGAVLNNVSTKKETNNYERYYHRGKKHEPGIMPVYERSE